MNESHNTMTLAQKINRNPCLFYSFYMLLSEKLTTQNSFLCHTGLTTNKNFVLVSKHCMAGLAFILLGDK